MPYGLTTTLLQLRRTPNEAAVTLLVEALDSDYPQICEGALEILAGRRNLAGHQAVINRIGQFNESQLALLRNTKHRMHAALAESLNSADATICENASRVILALREYEMFPAIVESAERHDNRQADRVATTLVRLAKLLAEHAKAPAGDKPRQDPFFARRQALLELKRSLDRYHEHERLEIVEAYLMIVPHDHASLRQLLSSPSHAAYERLLESLHSSPAPDVMRLLFEFLKDARSPQSMLNVFARRVDHRFLEQLTESIGSPVSLRVLRNMERLDHVAWLQEDRDVVFKLDGPTQATAVELAMASSVPRDHVFVLLRELLFHGKAEGRRASCSAMADFQTPQADELVQRALEDEDTSVRAAAASQLRQRALPGVKEKLIELLDSESDELRRAAGSALNEYTFNHYVAEYAQMSDAERLKCGEIVGKTDPTAASQLIKELSGPSRTQRQRAVEMAQAMHLVEEVFESLIALLNDKQEIVALRTAAAEALAKCDNDASRAALKAAAKDSNLSVREAAEHSFASLPDDTWLEEAYDVRGASQP